MPNGSEKKRVKSGDKPGLGLKVASKEYQDTPVSETLVNGKEYSGTLYQKSNKYKPISTTQDTITNFMDEGGPEQYLRGSYESRKSPYKKKAPAPAKKSNSVVIDEIASKYRSK